MAKEVNIRIIILMLLSMLLTLLSGCASTRSAEEISVIQENEGFTNAFQMGKRTQLIIRETNEQVLETS